MAENSSGPPAIPGTQAPTLPAAPAAPKPAADSPAVSRSPSFLQRVREDLFRPRTKEERKKDKETHKGDTLREVVETIVFVVVLVLMLKAFVAEAFIIPTGSMATTLLGYHRHAHCAQCGHDFVINASSDAEEFNWFQKGPASAAVCPNCRFIQELGPSYDSGDKLLVLKPQYDFGSPQRWDVIVFKFPGKLEGDGRRQGGPQENFAAKNYIKRLWGLPGEKLSIWHGDIYLVTLGAGGKVERSILRKPPLKIMEMRRQVNNNDEQASDLKGTLPPHWADEEDGEGWSKGEGLKEFTLAPSSGERRLRYRNYVRPPPLPAHALRQMQVALQSMNSTLQDAERERYQGTKLLDGSLRRLAGNSHALDTLTLLPAKAKDEEFRSLLGRMEASLKEMAEGLPALVKAEGGGANLPGGLFNPKDSLGSEIGDARKALGEIGDLWKASLDIAQQPQLVTDFLGYNAGISNTDPIGSDFPRDLRQHEPHWVKDLMLDCEVEITQPGGELSVELNAGPDVHRATFDLSTGQCTLKATRFGDDGKGTEIATKQAPTSLKGTGRHRLRLANFDDRLIVWVDRWERPFGDGLEFQGPSAEQRGPRTGDVKPVSVIGRNAGLTIRHLQVWRDIYYTRSPQHTPEYEELHFADHSALSVAGFLGLPAKDQALPASGRVERWGALANQRPWYYPVGVREEFGREFADPTLPNGKPLGADEFFALGDNSTRSSDSRDWGPVPERMLLGKAVFVYWPLTRFGVIW